MYVSFAVQPRAFMIGTAAWAMPAPVWKLLVWNTGMPFVPGTLYSFRNGIHAFLNAAWMAGYCCGTTFASITEFAFTVAASPTTLSGAVVLGAALENW